MNLKSFREVYAKISWGLLHEIENSEPGSSRLIHMLAPWPQLKEKSSSSEMSWEFLAGQKFCGSPYLVYLVDRRCI